MSATVEMQLESPDGEFLLVLVRYTPGLRPRHDPPDPGQREEVELLRLTAADGSVPGPELLSWGLTWVANNVDYISAVGQRQ